MFHRGTKRELYFNDNQLNKFNYLVYKLILLEKKSVGRPKKINAVKSGELKKGECRFTFITTNKFVEGIKRGAKGEKLTIKDYLSKVLNDYWERNNPKNQNEQKMKEFINKNKYNN
jgi:hypothetical protein